MAAECRVDCRGGSGPAGHALGQPARTAPRRAEYLALSQRVRRRQLAAALGAQQEAAHLRGQLVRVGREGWAGQARRAQSAARHTAGSKCSLAPHPRATAHPVGRQPQSRQQGRQLPPIHLGVDAQGIWGARELRESGMKAEALSGAMEPQQACSPRCCRHHASPGLAQPRWRRTRGGGGWLPAAVQPSASTRSLSLGQPCCGHTSSPLQKGGAGCSGCMPGPRPAAAACHAVPPPLAEPLSAPRPSSSSRSGV